METCLIRNYLIKEDYSPLQAMSKCKMREYKVGCKERKLLMYRMVRGGYEEKYFSIKILLFSRFLDFSEESFIPRCTRDENSFRKVSNSLEK